MSRPGRRVASVSIGRCPACGLEIWALTRGDEGVIHATPSCKTFKDLDPLDFLRLVRDTRAGKLTAARSGGES